MNSKQILASAALAILLGITTVAADPTTVSTFESVGISWSPTDGAQDNVCRVRYREQGTTHWRQGYPLWYDDRSGEYRGSVVQLKPETTFEVELELSNTLTSATLTASTWSEAFPIAATVELPALSGDTLVIDQSGTPDGYVLYTFGSPGSAVIDVANARDQCVEIDASYIILRGLTLANARRHAIRLYDGAHDVVIEESEIHGWGRIDSDGWGVNYDSAIYSNSPAVERIIVQRNRMRDPRADSNHWDEPRPAHNDETHPRGPQAICLFDSDGNHVFRYNEVTTDEAHYFNDIFGAGDNFGLKGFPHRDSDIYGNFLSGCWDDGIEAEGGNRNVRIWGNYIEWTFVKIAAASTVTGPLYVWRNVSAEARRNDFDSWDIVSRGGFFKTSDLNAGGRMYVFHNTLLQPPPPVGSTWPLGCSPGLGHGGPMINAFTRNNVLHVYKPWHDSINDRCSTVCGDYDYDLYNGDLHILNDPPEPNGIHATPIYEGDNGPGEFALDPTSPGFDAGQLLSNFNDNYLGAGPDIGAFEAGSRPMEFGVDAHRLTLYEASEPQDLVSPAHAVAYLPAAPPFDHAPAAGTLLFYAVDDRRGYSYTLTLQKGGQGLLVSYD